jgi:hypothetical protein
MYEGDYPAWSPFIARLAMKEDESQSPHSANWRFLYRAAIFETDAYKKAARISEAEKAIIERMHESFRDTGADIAAERESMDDAMYTLRAWKTALEQKATRG